MLGAASSGLKRRLATVAAHKVFECPSLSRVAAHGRTLVVPHANRVNHTGPAVRISPFSVHGIRMMSDESKPKEEEKQHELKPEEVKDAQSSASFIEQEEPEPEPQIIDKETVVGEESSFDFKAETRQLLDIVANSLYQDKEVFIRELVSNASDALEKARYMAQVNNSGTEVSETLEVKVIVDPTNGMFMIQDNGIGMTADELRENLGTIAKSGSKAFLKELQEKQPGSADTAKNIIGKFGVGFYSSFMVSDEVTVYSRKRGDAEGHVWKTKTDGSFSIAKADGVEHGTKIVLKLRENCKDFASAKKVKDIVNSFSTFVAFPVIINGEKVTEVQALWLKDGLSVTEEEHKGLYKHLNNAWDEPHFQLMFKADAPIDIKSVFYTPARNQEKFGQNRMQIGVHLYSRRVLIQKHCKDLIPEYLRFVSGVVDSEDIPLSISRETMQDKGLMTKLRTVLTKRIIRWFLDEAKKDEKKYQLFYEQFSLNIKEGVAMDEVNAKDLVKLLRYSTSKVESDEAVPLQDVIDRMTPEQDSLYYLIASDRKTALASPYYEAFKRAGIEVVFCYALHDEIVMTNTSKFAGKTLKSIEIAEPPEAKDEPEDEAESKDGVDTKKTDKTHKKKSGSKLDTHESNELVAWLKITLDSRVTTVEVTNRLVDTPAIIADHDSAVTRRMMQMEEFKSLGVNRPAGHKLLINPRHDIIKLLHKTRHEKPDVAKLVAEQIMNNAMISAGMLEVANDMMPGINAILAQALMHGEDSELPEELVAEEEEPEVVADENATIIDASAMDTAEDGAKKETKEEAKKETKEEAKEK